MTQYLVKIKHSHLKSRIDNINFLNIEYMPNTKKDVMLKNITRTKKNWLVVIRRFGKVACTERFRDVVYGNADKSLRAAIIYRDKQLKEIDKLSDEYAKWRSLTIKSAKRNIAAESELKSRFLCKVGTKNTSGVLGVRFNKISQCWCAIWPGINGGQQMESFSIKRYGEEKAKLLAIVAREEGIKELIYLRGKLG